MPYFEDLKRYFLGTLYLLVFPVVFCAISDLKLRSLDFMNDNEIKAIKSSEDDFSSGRGLASENLMAQRIPFNQLDRSVINGPWLIFNKVKGKNRSEKMNLRVELELFAGGQGKGSVRVLKRQGKVFDANFLDVVFFREKKPGSYYLYLAHRDALGNDSEMYEASKIVETAEDRPKKRGPLSAIKPMANQKTKNNVNLPEEMEFVLISVVPNGNNKMVLGGYDISGSMKISNESIEFMYVRFEGADREEVSLEVKNSEIVNNYFQYLIDDGRQPVSAVINRSRQEEYIVTLINGPLSGTKLKFATEKLIAETEDEQRKGLEAEREVRTPAAAERVAKNSIPESPQDLAEKEEVQNDILAERYEQAEMAAEAKEAEQGAFEGGEMKGFEF